MKYFTIDEFYGIVQGRYGNNINPGSASDARNMDTSDGNLSVAAGFLRHIDAPIPGEGKLWKLMIARGTSEPFYVVAADGIYHYAADAAPPAWNKIHTFAEPLTKDVSYLQIKISTKDYLIVATGMTQLVKIDILTHEAESFGSGLKAHENVVASYTESEKKITLKNEITEEMGKRAVAFGVTIKEDTMAVEKVDHEAKTITLFGTPTTKPKADDEISIPGGGSEAHVNFLTMYYGRLFSAGDPENPGRLYWSTVPGDGRTVEDWLAVPGSADASGGHVDVGDTVSDPIIGIASISNQMLVFKRYTVYRLFGDRPGTFTIECIEPTSGIMSNASAVVKYDVPYYLGKQGIMYFNNVSVVPLDGGERFLRDFLDKVDVSFSRSAALRNTLYFSCREEPGQYDDSMIVYDATRGTSMIRNGFEVADLQTWNDSIFILSGTRRVCLFNSGNDYDGIPIEAYWETQETDLKEKYSQKQVKELFMFCDGGTIIVKLIAAKTRREVRKQLLFDATGEDLQEIQFQSDQSRGFKVRFENEAGSRFRIRGGIQIGFISGGRP